MAAASYCQPEISEVSLKTFFFEKIGKLLITGKPLRACGLIICILLAFFTPALALDPLLTLDVHDASLTEVFALLGADAGVNIVTDDSVKPERITLHLSDVSFDEALTVILRAYGLQAQRTE